MQLLLIEDDTAIAQALMAALQLQCFGVYHAATVAAADLAVEAFNFDIVILDLGLPDGDGINLLRRWRAAGLLLPVLILLIKIRYLSGARAAPPRAAHARGAALPA